MSSEWTISVTVDPSGSTEAILYYHEPGANDNHIAALKVGSFGASDVKTTLGIAAAVIVATLETIETLKAEKRELAN